MGKTDKDQGAADQVREPLRRPGLPPLTRQRGGGHRCFHCRYLCSAGLGVAGAKGSHTHCRVIGGGGQCVEDLLQARLGQLQDLVGGVAVFGDGHVV